METVNLEWSLKPITNLLKISGIPTHDGRKIKFFLRVAFNIIVVLSFFTNLFFNDYWYQRAQRILEEEVFTKI